MGAGVTGDVGGEGTASDVDGEGAAADVMGVAMLMWVLQVVCRLVAPLVLSLRRVVLGVLWAVVLSVVPMVRVTQAMHRVTVRPVCAVGDALGMGGGGLEGGLPLVQRAMVALVSQVVGRLLVLLVMTRAGGGVAGDGRLRG